MIGGVFNTARDHGRGRHLGAGDVILIELQATGPNGKYVAMQYWDDVFSAIQAATAKGITVVEAAGNGNENFDLPIFAGTGLQKDFGAIVVGADPADQLLRLPRLRRRHELREDRRAAVAHLVLELRPYRQRPWLGLARHDLRLRRRAGWCVENRWYTHRFSGTSSASPIVTGAVAVLQGILSAMARCSRRRRCAPS